MSAKALDILATKCKIASQSCPTVLVDRFGLDLTFKKTKVKPFKNTNST